MVTVTKDEQITMLIGQVVESSKTLAKIADRLAEQNGRFADRVLTRPEDQIARIEAMNGRPATGAWPPNPEPNDSVETEDNTAPRVVSTEIPLPPMPDFSPPAIDGAVTGGPGAGPG